MGCGRKAWEELCEWLAGRYDVIPDEATIRAAPAMPPCAAGGSAEVLVQTVALERVYRRGSIRIPALTGVDITIHRGQFVAFRGRSGSGKTTLLNLIAGLDDPTGGQVLLFGRDLSQLCEVERTRLRREHLGFVFQSFSLIPTLSALENVEVPLRIAGAEAGARRARAMRCLSVVGLRPWADHRPFEMSGGQQQRLSIARALTCRPALIIADEPTSELDSETGRRIFMLFQRLVREEGVTILMASHDPKADEFASDLYRLVDGRIEAHLRGGSPSA
jgi:putative ABC transport system ATP-binding protein